MNSPLHNPSESKSYKIRWTQNYGNIFEAVKNLRVIFDDPALPVASQDLLTLRVL